MPGPQTQAYFSLADVLLYVGEAGGSKTDSGLGLDGFALVKIGQSINAAIDNSAEIMPARGNIFASGTMFTRLTVAGTPSTPGYG